MSDRRKPTRPYDVGYAKTPVHARFKPGQSGNPKGRPKGRKDPLRLLDKVLAQKVTINDGRTTRKIPILEAGLLSVAAKGAKGDLKSVRFLMDLAVEAQALNPTQGDYGLAANDLAIIDAFVARLRMEIKAEDEDPPMPAEPFVEDEPKDPVR